MVKVEMNIQSLDFELKITDNGRGFAPGKNQPGNVETRVGRGGNGLKNMHQRLTAVGGECVVSSVPGTGRVMFFSLSSEMVMFTCEREGWIGGEIEMGKCAPRK